MPSIASRILAVLGAVGTATNGDDVLDLPSFTSIRGLDGDDVIRGGPGDNLLQGDAGNDAITGGGGNDRLEGGTGNDALEGGDGNDLLDGGSGFDTMAGGAGNDTYIVDNPLDSVAEFTRPGEGQGDPGGIDTVKSSISFVLGQLSGTNYVENLVLFGTDPIVGEGNALDNRITGNSAANTLSGGGGRDIVKGLGGNDTLRGGAGFDLLIGGLGADHFVFSPSAKVAKDVDRIADFHRAAGDKIDLAIPALTALSSKGVLQENAFYAAPDAHKAHDATDRIIYNTSTGVLYYDPDGTGRLGAIPFAWLLDKPDLVHSDFLIVT